MKGQPLARFALMVGLVAPSAPSAGQAAEPSRPRPSSGADIQCHPDQDISCTLVRETLKGVVVWTERYQPTPSPTARWSLVLDPGTLVSGDIVRVIPAPTGSTPNGAPILE